MVYQTQMNEHWDRVRTLFAGAADLPPDQREAFLNEHCKGDAALRAEVMSLLEAEPGASSYVVKAIGQAAVKMTAAQPDRRDWMAGPYRIIGELGHGGMGTVYLAERADHQFRKKVAIKMARFAAHEHVLLDRFRYERQILAALEHPNIARLLDGGETSDGIPFLVMEYVEGSPVTQYVSSRSLDLAARLELFLKIAAAVQYAHQSLIIHRDLKPGNILVAENGEPKLLDFGIAKLLDHGVFDETVVNTSTGLRLLTPDYASPEQVRGLPVTTATDIYSLGAVLYEIITGARPHAITEYSPVAIDRAVCETPTEPPSKAAARTGTLGAKSSRLPSDLDVIVLKAMHKEPARRYSSVEHLADDIRRFLTGLPIQARADSQSYRIAKFLRRHRMGALAAVLLFVTLIGGIAATSWQAYRARQEARRADLRFRQVRHLAQRFLFDFDEQIRNLEGSTPARAALVKTAQEYLDSLAAESANDPELARELALAYKKLGEIQGGPWNASMARTADAVRSYGRSIEIGRGLMNSGVRDPALLEHMIQTTRSLGLVENRVLQKGARDRYRQRVDESIALAEMLYSERADATSARLLAAAYRERGEHHAHNNEPVMADQFYTKALPLYQEVQRKNPDAQAERGLMLISERLGDAKVMLGDLEQGRRYYEDAVRRARTRATANDAGVAERRGFLSTSLSLAALLGDPQIPNLGLTTEAVAPLNDALSIGERLAQSDPANRTAKIDLAYTEAQFGRTITRTQPREAVRRLKRAVALADEVWRTSPNDRVYARYSLQYRKDLGTALVAAGNLAEAKREFEHVRLDFANVANPGNDHRIIEADARRELGLMLRTSNRREASRLVTEAVATVEAYLRQHLYSIEMVDDLSRFYEAAGLFDSAFLDKARALWIEWPKAGFSSEYDRKRLRQIVALSARNNAI